MRLKRFLSPAGLFRRYGFFFCLWFGLTATAMAQNGETAGATAAKDISFARAFFFSQGSVFGTAIIWFLLALSAVSLGLIGYLWMSNRRANILPDAVVEESRQLLSAREYRALISLADKERSFFSLVFGAALHEASHGFSAMIRSLEQAGEEFTARRFRQIEVLNVIGNVAPMIGLFGTVYGMILAFRGIVEAGGRPDPVDLAAGIGTALTTTFWGLIVAIPSLAAYAMIRNNIEALTSEAMLSADEMVNAFRPTPTGGAKSSPDRPAQPPKSVSNGEKGD